VTARVATIDIGTNSVLLLVAELRDGRAVAVEERATVTRLGEGVDRSRTLLPAAIERTLACLDDYGNALESLGASRVGIVGTSALRDAAGGDRISAFCRDRLGAPLRVISGLEEARLTFLGATSALDEIGNGRVVAFDVGGGSTEVVVGTREAGSARIELAESFDVGSVRVTERCLKGDPPTPDELSASEGLLGRTFASLPDLSFDGPPIGIAGTVTTFAAIELGMATYDGSRVHGHRMPFASVERIVERLASMKVAERKGTVGLHPARADVIVAGGLVVLAVLRKLGKTELRVSDRGIRWGLAEELLAARASSAQPH